MRVLVIAMEGTGGMFQYAALLSNALAQQFEVSAIIPLNGEAGFLSSDVRVLPTPMGDTKKRFLLGLLRPDYFLRFLRTVDAVRPDVVHLHTIYNPWLLPLLGRLRRYPIVITVPEGDFHQGMRHRWEMRITRALCVRACDAAIVLNEQDRQQASGYLADKRAFVIPHGVNTLFLQTSPEQAPEHGYVLFFGRIAPFKGLDALLEAMSLVRRRRPEAKLVLAAHGDLRPYASLIRAAGDAIEVRNRFVPTDEMAELFQGAALVALPYTEQDHSGVVPIAYAFSRPVVASSLVDMVEPEGTGLVVPPNDPTALAEGIVRLLEDSDLRQKMGERAREKAVTELSWEAIAERTSEAYRFAIGGKAGLVFGAPSTGGTESGRRPTD